MQLINEHQEAFIQFLNRNQAAPVPVPQGPLGVQAEGSAQGAVHIRVTPQEKEAIDRVSWNR